MSAVEKLSKAQEEIVELPAESFVVSACAGSGKTKTAVHRVAAMQNLLTDRVGRILLLSFSNVAVETFQREYGSLVSNGKRWKGPIVEIDTVDSFLTKNLLRPHGHLVMGCDRCPFLVEGREPFLKHFTVWDGSKPAKTSDLRISMDGGTFSFRVGKWAGTAIARTPAIEALEKLGAIGAYTHESARYWAYRLLNDAPFVLRAISRRYSHILVDEAQDIGTIHQALLEKISDAGAKLSLIGDVNQGIFEFTGATGDFLGNYHSRAGVTAKELNRNFRSVPSIVTIANQLSGRKDEPDRSTPDELNGAFYIAVDHDKRDEALLRFRELLEKGGIVQSKGVVVFRSSEVFNTWSGPGDPQGQGVVKSFVASARWRDQAKRFDQAFSQACAGIVGLLDDDHGDLLSLIRGQAASQELRGVRREIWNFVKNPATGLPSSELDAVKEWHPQLVVRVKALLARLEKQYGLAPGANLGNRLKKTALPNGSLVNAPEGEAQNLNFRLSTVHKVKGESLDGVMYVASKSNIEELLAGTKTENGKIGYVALTRARNVFVLAVPSDALAALKSILDATGFQDGDVCAAADA
ncbi:ATP-dependent helicase [Agrobacterium rhizogenes]|uniref:ATP-dependent helicase n=1 Tax=Rhizobium rhizogenes TaxID=359 RepID=UPI00157299C6|nr:ATP-dependent helicase [Rhizobium rhizogenes]NTI16075.1 ATP-dependent helicase [Rhizobium rhizogenes]